MGELTIKEAQRILRKYVAAMAEELKVSAENLTHRGKQQLLIDAFDNDQLGYVKYLMDRIKKEDLASRDIRSGVRFDSDSGFPRQIGFIMPRHAFLAMLGAGAGHAPDSGRGAFDFYTPVITRHVNPLADMIAGFNADLLMKVFTNNYAFNKDVE